MWQLQKAVAATEGRVNIIESLIRKGADTNVKNSTGVSEIIDVYTSGNQYK